MARKDHRGALRPILRLAVLALALGGLSACAEVTRFNGKNGAVVYHVNCHPMMSPFESCRAAALRICPNGYGPTSDHTTLPYQGFFSCR